MRTRTALILTTLVLAGITLFAQSRTQNQLSIGILSEYGYGAFEMDGVLDNSVVLMGATIYLPLFQTHSFFNCATELYPHAGVSEFNGDFGAEFGLNVRSRFNFALNPDHIFCLLVGSGPHWMFTETPRQATGFIFSNNMLLGFETKLPNRPQTLFFQGGWRHLSNLGFKRPNAGLNFITFGIGFRHLVYGVFDVQEPSGPHL